MKIVSQSSNELLLQEGSASGIFVGSCLIAAGVLAAIFLHSSSSIAIYIGLAMAVIGVVIILFASAITVRIARPEGKIYYEKKRIVGTQATVYAISDVFRIETRRQWQIDRTPPQPNEAPRQPQLVSQSMIVFNSGQELALDHQKTAGTTQIGPAVLMTGLSKESALANQVAQFLNVPFLEIAPPSMGLEGQVNIEF